MIHPKPLFIGLAMLTACGMNNAKQADCITGKLRNANNQQLYLTKLTTTGFVGVDTTTLQPDGSFAFDAKLTEKAFYRIALTNENFGLLIADEKSKIYLESDAKTLSNITKIEGSEDAVLLNELQQKGKSNYLKMDSLQKTFEAQSKANPQGAQALQAQLTPTYNALVAERTALAKSFIDAHPTSYATLSAVEMLSEETDMEHIKKVDASMSKLYPTSQYVVAFHQHIAEISKLAEGSVAPEIILNTPEDKPLALSSLKGKVVLIDFWASWCRPCRAENPNVVRIYNAMHSKGLEIYSVSLDNNKEAWTKAIAKDNLTWYHVSDLNQWNNAAARTYGVTSIPQTYLLDRNGKIAAKNLRGKELEDKVAELLK
jgi:peroxiredoxin